MFTSLKTPLGDIKILLDGLEMEFELEQKYSKAFPEVTTYHLKYNYRYEGKSQVLKCILCDTEIQGYSESGERLETVAFDSKDPLVRLSIGIEGEFVGYITNDSGEYIPCYEADVMFDGAVIENGLEIEIKNNDTNEYIFSVAWMSDYNFENEYKTWFMADPAYKE